MFFLYTSNRTEQLIERLAGVIDDGGGPALFGGETFLIQNRGVERLLSQSLADVFGVWCNATYLLPGRFIEFLCERVLDDADPRAYERAALVWRLERHLRAVEDPVAVPLRRYLSGGQPQRLRYQLAYRLANLFDQYQVMRPELLAGWERGKVATGTADEAWQCSLWNALRADDPTMRHRGELIEAAATALTEESHGHRLGLQRLFVFGIHTLPPLFLHVLNGFARHRDVHFFLLSPCRQYWGDIETKRQQLRRQPAGALLGAESLGDRYHPLLASLGRQGAHFQELLLTLMDGWHEEDLFVEPAADGSLLERLQADLLDGCSEPAGPETTVGGDDSLVIVSCHSRHREIMVLKDFLLDRLYREPSLDLHDIVVMAPDIEAYAPYIPAVFGELAHEIGDCRIRRENSLLDGFLQFLQVFSSRYTWSDLLGLLERPEIAHRFGLGAADLELIRSWVFGAGIRWGLSADQRQEDGCHPFARATWSSGLERLLMGLAVDSDEPVQDILPFTDIEGAQGELLGGLYRFVSFIDEARALFRHAAPVAGWCERLREWCAELFDNANDTQLLTLLHLIDDLEQAAAWHHGEPVVGEVITAWLEQHADTRSSSGFLGGRLTFCSLLPMRSVPFPVICLLGLNDGEFPRDDHFASFDLLGRDYRPGDRSRRADDRYQFLEALLAARQTLYLSYIGQSIRTNKPIPPSVVVTELVETLEQWYAVTDLVRRHPLQPFHSGYFTGHPSLFSYDQSSCLVAQALAAEKSRESRGRWLKRALPVGCPHQITGAELLAFLRHPHRYLVRTMLGIRLDRSDDLPDEHEPFAVDGLDRYRAEQLIVDGLLRDCPEELVLRRLQEQLFWPLGTPGSLAFSDALEEIQPFVRILTSLDLGEALPPEPFAIEVAGFALSGLLAGRRQKGLLFYRHAALRGADLLQAWLWHLLSGLASQRQAPTTLVARDEILVIDGGYGDEDDLACLVQLFVEGRRFPSELFVEAGLAYARQSTVPEGRNRKTPLEAARSRLADEYRLSGGAVYHQLFGDLPVEELLGNGFVACCERLLLPLWQMAQKDRRGGVDA